MFLRQPPSLPKLRDAQMFALRSAFPGYSDRLMDTVASFLYSSKSQLDFPSKRPSHRRMATILIAYDIHPSAGDAYEQVTDAIRSLGEWWHHLESAWLVKTDRTPRQIRDLLKECIGSDDQLLIVDISHDVAAWFGVNDAGSRWLETSLEKAFH